MPAVSAQRPRRARGKQNAVRATTGARIPQDRLAFGRRKKPKGTIAGRLLQAAKDRLTASRPMLMLTAGFLALTGIAALFVGGYVGRAIHGVTQTADALVADAGFGIANVDIAGNRRTGKDTILAVLDIQKDQTTLSYDIHAAQARLSRLPWVAGADVRRRYPDTIAVTLAERRPFALWRTDDGIAVIDRDGHVITKTGGLEFQKLPRFVGEAPVGGAELVAAIARHRAVHARVWAMRRMGGRRWDLILDDQVVVQLPELGWKQQLDELEHLLVDTGVLERDIREIDLRERDNYYFILKDGLPQAMPRGNGT
ncbi:MAG TPA: FtsQ-type POTRA domain-containing protein [Rhizomicrobium sp.]|nr:FtsQ-type POTRA domain-containing protein [Rhizomicrobium sp.]